MNQWGPVCVCIGRERGRAVSVQTEDHQAEAERSEGHQRPTGHDEDSNELGSCSQNQTKLQKSQECLQSTSNLRKRQI